MQNSFVETFIGCMRDKCLNEHLFYNLRPARNLAAAWCTDFKSDRPHPSLAGMTPAQQRWGFWNFFRAVLPLIYPLHQQVQDVVEERECFLCTRGKLCALKKR